VRINKISFKRLCFFVFLTLLINPWAHHRAQASDCTYTREYITTLEYLRKQKIFSVSEPEARKTAKKISLGCTGAAQRFIKVSSVLRHAELLPKDAIQIGTEFASLSDIAADSFVAIFLKAYLPEFLDLDVQSSIKMARSLSSEFRGDILAVRDDFEKLIEFCVSSKDLGLPKPQCGGFAVRIAQKGEKFSGGVSNPYIQAFYFLTSEQGPHLTTAQAITLAESLIENGRDAVDNFIQAFKYGISPQGLGFGTQDAIHFAQEMTFHKNN
jgi:hypothetical protein